MFKSFKYRLRPTKKQEKTLLAHIDECRILYNQLLCARKQAWKNENKSLSQYDQTNTIPLLKQQHVEFTQVYSQVLQQVSARVDLAFKGFFRRLKERAKTGEKAGFPRYKGQHRYDSITYPNFSSGCRLDSKGLRLSKIGCIRVVQHRPLGGIAKSCTITRTATGKWYASIPCDIGDISKKTDTNSAVGIDVGLNSFAVTSDEQTIASQRFFRKEEKTLAKAQRKWDAVKKRPKTDAVKEKRRKVIARVHERIRNKRHNFAHQESRKIVNRYGFIAVEKLKVQKMQKNRRLSKSIADAAWSLFRHCLEYKAEEAGIGFKAVKPEYTSQDCSACGHREKKALSERVHHCKKCGYTADRDLNAAINILTLGLQRQAVWPPRSPLAERFSVGSSHPSKYSAIRAYTAEATRQ